MGAWQLGHTPYLLCFRIEDTIIDLTEKKEGKLCLH